MFVQALTSSVGQTFFISLFIPYLSSAAHASPMSLATWYGVATFASAFCLARLGPVADHFDLVWNTLATALAICIGCAVLGLARTEWQVVLGFFILRLFAQGLLPHLGFAALARSDSRRRGRYLSIAVLGLAVGEGILPLIVTSTSAIIGWSGTYLATAMIFPVAIVPFSTLLVRGDPAFRSPIETSADAQAQDGPSIYRNPEFWTYFPLIALSPFAGSGLIFFQSIISRDLDLPISLFASAFAGYALMQLPSSLGCGILLDRIGSRLALILHVLPMALGSALLAALPSAWAAWPFLALLGATASANSVLRTAMVADVAPARAIGRARGEVASILVISAAAGPAAFGFLYRIGVSSSGLLWTTVALAFGASAVPLTVRMARGLTWR